MIRLVGSKLFAKRPGWGISLALVVLFLFIPLILVLVNFFQDWNENWMHILVHLLPRYLGQTLILSLGVGVGTGILGVWSAWILTRYRLPWSKTLEFFSFLPLAVPAYILAFVLVGFFDYTGPFQLFFRNVLGWSPEQVPQVDLMNIYGLILVMSLSLYPYVFSVARSAFSQQSNDYLEAARSLGASKRKAFWTIALPLARPALVGGLSLVLMETLSEYGAVKYFGVENFTTGIFRAWFDLQDPSVAMKLAGILLVFTFGILAIERTSRGRRSYALARSRPQRDKDRPRLRGAKSFGAMVLILIPVVLGFFLPVGMLLWWGGAGIFQGLVGLITLSGSVWNNQGLETLVQTFGLGLGAAIVVLTVALVLVHGKGLFPKGPMAPLIRFSAMGYGIPGAVLALGVLIFSNGVLLFIHRNLGDFGQSTARFFMLHLGLGGVLFAYLVRYLAVAYKPLEGNYQNLGRKLAEASLSLGHSPGYTLLRVNLPILVRPIFTAALLVFIDVIKELPITLILRPFNFETLATETFYKASIGDFSDAAPYALGIIVLGLIPTFILATLRREKKSIPPTTHTKEIKHESSVH